MFFFTSSHFQPNKLLPGGPFRPVGGGGGGGAIAPYPPPCLRACIKSYIAHTLKFPFYIQKLKTDSECSATFVKLIWPSLIKYIFANRILLFLFYKPRNLWGAKRDNIVQLYIYGNKKYIYIYINQKYVRQQIICVRQPKIYVRQPKIYIRQPKIYVRQPKYV